MLYSWTFGGPVALGGGLAVRSHNPKWLKCFQGPLQLAFFSGPERHGIFGSGRRAQAQNQNSDPRDPLEVFRNHLVCPFMFFAKDSEPRFLAEHLFGKQF